MYELLLLVVIGVMTFSIVVGIAYILKRSADSKKKKEIITASKKPTKRFDIDYDKLRESSSLRGSNKYYSSDSSRRGGISAITHMAEAVDEEKGGIN